MSSLASYGTGGPSISLVLAALRKLATEATLNDWGDGLSAAMDDPVRLPRGNSPRSRISSFGGFTRS